MNKSQFIEEFKKRLTGKKFKNLNTDYASDIVDLFIEFVTTALQKKKRVEFRGFGVFEMRPYKGYSGLNPRTKKPVMAKSKYNPFFKCGKNLLEIPVSEKPQK